MVVDGVAIVVLVVLVIIVVAVIAVIVVVVAAGAGSGGIVGVDCCCSRCCWTRATIKDVHLFFSEVPQFGSLRPLPKTDLEEKKHLLPDKTIPYPGWPRHSTKFMHKMAYYFFFF